MVARALDDNNLVLLASLDLSAAFDIVNVDLLIKRLTVAGLPSDIIHFKDRIHFGSVQHVLFRESLAMIIIIKSCLSF